MEVRSSSPNQPLLDITKRDTYDHDKFDIDLLQDVKGMNQMKQKWKFSVETVVATWILFNAISTIMIIVENFRKTVSEQTRNEFGKQNFDILTYTIMYFPVVFFFLLWLLFNNAFAEMTFYMYIRRGAIVDFPESSSPRFLVTHLRPLLFLIIFLGYAGASIFTMLKFAASIGTIAIFCNNLFIGVGLFWWRQQSIEWKFVSISDFIQAFPDRTNSHGNMDEVSLHHAAKLMEDFTLTESLEPSYSGYMRNFYWQNQNYGGCSRVMHHVLYWGVIAALAGLSVAYFYILGRFDVKSRWDGEINPCTAVCADLAKNLSVVTTEHCQNCLCACMDKMQARDSSFLEVCDEYYNAPACTNVPGHCPSTCGFADPKWVNPF